MANLNLNKVILGGRLTAEPELKSTPSGTPVLSFTIACTRKYAQKAENGAQAPQSDFFHKLRRMASDSGIHSAVFPQGLGYLRRRTDSDEKLHRYSRKQAAYHRGRC